MPRGRTIAAVTAILPTKTPTYALAALCSEMADERYTLQQAIDLVAGAYAATAVWRCHGRRAAAAMFLQIPEERLHQPGARAE
jgi:hypothetical protein